MPLSSPARLAMISGHSASVPSNPFGPCCSVEPMGMRIAFDVSRYLSISGQEERWSCITVFRYKMAGGSEYCMIPWVLLDKVTIAGGDDLRLMRRGEEFSILSGP